MVSEESYSIAIRCFAEFAVAKAGTQEGLIITHSPSLRGEAEAIHFLSPRACHGVWLIRLHHGYGETSRMPPAFAGAGYDGMTISGLLRRPLASSQ